jgi:prolyl oligopeptidase
MPAVAPAPAAQPPAQPAAVLPPAAPRPAFAYPATKTVDASDTYFGVTYMDRYRWLEDLKSQETQDWFKAQAKLADSFVDSIPGRDALVKEWLDLDKLKVAAYRDFNMRAGRLFYRKTAGGENVGKLYVREGWNGAERLLFDPASYRSAVATAGATTSIQQAAPAWNGKYVVLGVSSGGAEHSELRVLEVATGKLLPDSIYPSYGPMGWLPDGSGFLYDAPKTADVKSPDYELHHKTRLHKLGADASKDLDVFSDESAPDLGILPKEFASAWISERAPKYVVGALGTVQNEQRAYVALASDVGKRAIRWRPLIDRKDDIVDGPTIVGESAYGVTYDGAPHHKLVRTSVDHPDWAHAETVLAEASDTIDYVTRSKSFLFVVYSNGVTGRIVKYDPAAKKAAELALPDKGSVGVHCPEARSDRCIVTISTWTKPTTMYDLDAGKGTLQKSIFNTDVVYPGFDQLVSEEVEVPGHDGAMVPLSIIHKKGMPMDGSSSCILEGYGAYGISWTPWFDLKSSIALHGVVVAYAHPRGGSEKGHDWYKAGFKQTKPNTWKDFISAAEYLVKAGYTSPAHLAGRGTSAGGVLISRAVTERPDLFAAAVCNVGMANALRFEFSSNGPPNVPEFGSVTDPNEVKWLAEMDGVSHVVAGVEYPAILGVGGWNDPRVAVWEPGKFVAAVQVASASDRPAFLMINYDNGHFTEEKQVTFRNFASQHAFVLWQTGHPEFQPATH